MRRRGIGPGSCLLRCSDRRRRGHRLTEHTLPRAGGLEAGGGAPAVVTGTNKEVLCARATAPRCGPRPAPAARGPAPLARAPPPGPRSDAGAGRGPPPERRLQRARYASVWREGVQKKLCAFFFSLMWVQETSVESRLLL